MKQDGKIISGVEEQLRPLLERETQLNLFAYFTILSLSALSCVLIFMLLTKIPMPSNWILENVWTRSIGLAFILSIVVYLADQQRRLQLKLRSAYEALDRTRIDLQESYDRLAFAYRTAETMARTPGEAGIRELMEDVMKNFQGDAVGLMGAETELVLLDESNRDEASDAITRVALETVSHGSAISMNLAEDGSSALAVPLRVDGHLNDVLCVWRRDGEMKKQSLEGLKLVARILELSMENHQLLENESSMQQRVKVLLGQA